MEWLQLVYKIPAEPSRKRTYIWRQLKGLGALYLQDGCCVLPRTEATHEQLQNLAAKIREFEGEATLSLLLPAEPGWEERLIAAANRARDEEYQELVDTAERLEEEIARETRKGKLTFAVLEEVEDDHERLQRWLERVRERDVLHASGRHLAEAAVEGAQKALETFASQVYPHEPAPATMRTSEEAEQTSPNDARHIPIEFVADRGRCVK